jgi:hypothetical protein
LANEFQHSSDATWKFNDPALDTSIFYPNAKRIDWKRCPIIIQDHLGLSSIFNIKISLFESISEIVESSEFARQLSRLDGRILKIWNRRRADLARSVQLNGLGFQRWKRGGANYYSIKLDGNYRAHLRYDSATRAWFAETIGDHKTQGHG